MMVLIVSFGLLWRHPIAVSSVYVAITLVNIDKSDMYMNRDFIPYQNENVPS